MNESQYRAFGETSKSIVTDGAEVTLDFYNSSVEGKLIPFQFMVIHPLTDCILDALTLKFDRSGSGPYSFTAPAGVDVIGVTAFSLTTGTAEVFWYR